MEKILNLISGKVSAAFEAAGFEPAFGRVTVSNRPDLCEYQCNGALAAAKAYRRAPIQIADAVKAQLADCPLFSEVQAVMPGFLNLRLDPAWLADWLEQTRTADRFGMEPDPKAGTVVVDYGGANVAKPLHIGHLRSAIIGESVKRIQRFFGNEAVGDVHLGDWGLQMGLVIAALRERQPELCYFDESFTGPWPEEAPFTISDLEEIYPAASAKSKVDEAFAAAAHDATFQLQQGRPGYYALWQHILGVSKADLKKNYGKLGVHFEYWLGESDAQAYIPPMLDILNRKHLLTESDGAKIVEVQEPTDTKEVPPCIIMKSDGATLYATTDLATILQRQLDFCPGKIIYLTDKRQNLHFEQVFRVTRKAELVPAGTELRHIGFGTMNGKDGKPFKTRSGGVMRLETLIGDITDFVRAKVEENNLVSGADVENVTAKIALAALKYGDLMNAPTKDYVFDLDKFAAFEGNTGPYILYTIVRIKSILARYGAWEDLPIRAPETREAKDLMLALTRMPDALEIAYRDCAPNMICSYIYELAGFANKFYHETRILTEEDPEKQKGYVALIGLTKRVLETCIDLLGFEAPEKM